MKKIMFSAISVVVLTCMSSCYSTKLLVGNVDPKEPLVQINKEWNNHLIGGLVPLESATMKTSEYVNNAENYVVKTNISFLNYLVSGITGGIYTPTQTKYYIPLKDTK